MKHSKLFRDIRAHNANIEQENRDKLRALYDEYLARKEREREVNEHAETAKE